MQTARTFVVHSYTNLRRIGLRCTSDTGRLIVEGPADTKPDLVIQSFDAVRDVYYHVPSPLATTDLSREVAVHFPKSLRDHFVRPVFASTLSTAVLLQPPSPMIIDIDRSVPQFSPLTALAILLERIGSVNAGILQADNNGLLFIRKAGAALDVQFSPRNIAEFLSLSREARDAEFSDFDTVEYILSGTDVSFQHERHLHDEPLTRERTISFEDLAGICEFSDEAKEWARSEATALTLAIGAAVAFHEIRMAA